MSRWSQKKKDCVASRKSLGDHQGSALGRKQARSTDEKEKTEGADLNHRIEN